MISSISGTCPFSSCPLPLVCAVSSSAMALLVVNDANFNVSDVDGRGKRDQISVPSQQWLREQSTRSVWWIFNIMLPTESEKSFRLRDIDSRLGFFFFITARRNEVNCLLQRRSARREDDEHTNRVSESLIDERVERCTTRTNVECTSSTTIKKNVYPVSLASGGLLMSHGGTKPRNRFLHDDARSKLLEPYVRKSLA